MSILKLTTETALIGEGPFWDTSKERLYYVDINGNSVIRLDPTTGVSEKREFENTVSFVIPCQDNTDNLVLGLGKQIVIYNWNDKTLNVVTEVEKDCPKNRFNDAKCDSNGNLWAGTMLIIEGANIQEIPEQWGALYRLDSKRNLQTVVNEVALSNGLEWTRDNSTMFFVDSGTYGLYAYDFDIDSGAVKNRRTVLNFKTLPNSKEFGVPDGLTQDTEGKLWLACCDGGRVIRIDPETGKVIQKVLLPAKYTTSCCFGGPNFQDLFVTTAKFNSNDEPDGHTYRITGLGVKGFPAATYASS